MVSGAGNFRFWAQRGLVALDERSGESYSARNCTFHFDSRVTSMIGGDCTRPAWVAGGGEDGGRKRAQDWSPSPPGHPGALAQSGKNAIRHCLQPRLPVDRRPWSQLEAVFHEN